SPQVIRHYNLFRSAEINGSAAPGRSSGEGIAAMEALAKKALPNGMAFEWSGLSLEEIESGGKALILFALGLVVVYLTLAAQYESYVLPFIVLLAVPVAILGAFGAQGLRANRPENRDRHGQQHDKRKHVTLVLCCQRQVHHHQAQGKKNQCLSSGFDFFQRQSTPFEGHAIRQGFLGK